MSITSEYPQVKDFIIKQSSVFAYYFDEYSGGGKYIISAEKAGIIIQCTVVKDDDPSWFEDWRSFINAGQ